MEIGSTISHSKFCFCQVIEVLENISLRSCVLRCSVVSNSLRPYGPLQAPLSMGILQARILGWVAMISSRGSSQPRIEPRSPTLQGNSLPSQPPGIPNPGIESTSPALAGGFFTTKPSRKPWEKEAIEKTNFRKLSFFNWWVCCYLETEYIHFFFTIIWDRSFEKHFEKWFWLIVMWLDHMGE